jgi:hypothetical protein
MNNGDFIDALFIDALAYLAIPKAWIKKSEVHMVDTAKLGKIYPLTATVRPVGGDDYIRRVTIDDLTSDRDRYTMHVMHGTGTYTDFVSTKFRCDNCEQDFMFFSRVAGKLVCRRCSMTHQALFDTKTLPQECRVRDRDPNYCDPSSRWDYEFYKWEYIGTPINEWRGTRNDLEKKYKVIGVLKGVNIMTNDDTKELEQMAELFPDTKEAAYVLKWLGCNFSNPFWYIALKGKEKEVMALAKQKEFEATGKTLGLKK